MSIIHNRQEKFGAPGLLALVGIGMVVGYSLHLAKACIWLKLALRVALWPPSGMACRSLS